MDKKTAVIPVFTTVLLLLLSACAGKTAVSEAPADQAPAAEELGITKSLLQYKIKKYGILKKS